jgi:hypothetical protein
MVYRVGIDLGFTNAHFDVRRDNEKVWRFHEKMGATLILDDRADRHYEIDRSDIVAALDRYAVPIEVTWPARPAPTCRCGTPRPCPIHRNRVAA